MPDSVDREIRALQAVFWSEQDPEGLAFAPLADAFRRKGEIREALDLLTDGMSRHPDYVTGHVIATRTYLDTAMHFEAELAARRVLELDPENLVGLFAMVSCLTERGEVEEAGRHATALQAVDPDSVEAREASWIAAPAAEKAPESDWSADLAVEEPPAEESTGIPAVVAGDVSTGRASETLLEELELVPSPDVGVESDEEELAGAMDVLGLEPDARDAIDEPEEAEEPVMELAALAPDEPEEAEEPVMELAALAPDGPEEAEEPVMELAALAPDGPEEAEEPVMELAALAPDGPEEAEEPVMELAALAPDPVVRASPPEEDVAMMTPDEPVFDLDDLALASPVPEDDDDPGGVDPEGEESMPVYTRTLADLYVRQGFTAKALEVLRHLQEREPDASDLADRIAAIESGDATMTRSASSGRSLADVGEESNAAAMPVHAEEEDDVELRARELAEGGLDAVYLVDTPFAWHDDAEPASDDADEPAIGGYFEGLLDWENRTDS